MRILILSDANSSHTRKWVNSLIDEGIEILLFSLTKCDEKLYKNVEIINFGLLKNEINTEKNDSSKLKYFNAIPIIKKAIKNFKPDIVHAHFISSYGFLASLVNFHPLIISVWGNDIYAFPRKTFLHKQIIKFALRRADKIFSTSKTMAHETQKYTSKNIEFTPFGINLSTFKPETISEKDYFYIGAIKSIDKTYGTEYLIRAFKSVKNKLPQLKLKLLLVGQASKSDLEYYNYLLDLIEKLEISSDVILTGQVDYEKISYFHNLLDIGVYLSLQESFGVSALETSACEKPVIVSDIPAYCEIFENGKTGIIVPKMNYEVAANEIVKLIEDQNYRNKIGKNARKMVEDEYDWKQCVEKVINIYNKLIKK